MMKWKRKKKSVKLSDEVVLQKWGKPERIIATEDEVIIVATEISKPIRGGRNIFLDPITEQPKVDLEKLYEYINPGKHAVWRGNVTKQFLKWKTEYVVS